MPLLAHFRFQAPSMQPRALTYPHIHPMCNEWRPARKPRPVWGTCAGCILLSDTVINGRRSESDPDPGSGRSFKAGPPGFPQ